MKKVLIVAAKRSAIGKFMGSLSTLSPGELGGKVIDSIIRESGVEPNNIDRVIVGNILSAGQGQGIARQCSLGANIPVEVPAYSLNMVCGSGMKSVINGVMEIALGFSQIVIAGGTEVMSGAGFVAPGTIRGGVKMGNIKLLDHMVVDGLTDVFNNYHMGVTAENIAKEYSITREEQDSFALESQKKAIASVDGGLFDKEIVPIEIANRRETIVVNRDEYPNRTTSAEKLAKLPPAFLPNGTVTAGNASGINDGASFVMLASQEACEKYGLKPLAEIVSFGEGGVDPKIMGMGPIPAIREALKRGALKLEEIELLELNEAFAAQSLGVMKELIGEHSLSTKFFDERCNINGGAIALGHPIGASGNRILVTLLHSLEREQKSLGLASLCIGGGMGSAMVIKRVD
ncbi:MAG: acetyl-CoA C-acetyltransferase [Bacteroidales bacterium]